MYLSLVPFVLTSLLTCGIRTLVWIYTTTGKLNDVCEEKVSNPGLRVFLCIVVPGYFIYCIYELGKRIDSLEDRNGRYSHSATACAIYACFGGFVLATAILQYRLNYIERGPEVKGKNEYLSLDTKYDLQKLYVAQDNLLARMVCTFGIYNLFWVYRLTGYLNSLNEFEKRNPSKVVLFCIICPPYILYWLFQSALRVEVLSEKHGLGKEDLVTVCSFFSCLSYTILPSQLLQKKVNHIVLKAYAEEHGALHSKYDVVTRQNEEYFTIHFNRMDERLAQTDWNWVAFFFGGLWFFYRRCNSYGLACVLADAISFLLICYGMVSSRLIWVGSGFLIIALLHVFEAIYANQVYKLHCEKFLKMARTMESEEEKEQFFMRRGSVSVPVVVMVVASIAIISSCSLVYSFANTNWKYNTNVLFFDGVYDSHYTSDIDPYFLKDKDDAEVKKSLAEAVNEREQNSYKKEKMGYKAQVVEALFRGLVS